MFVYKSGHERLQEILHRAHEESIATYARYRMIEMFRHWLFRKPGTTSLQLEAMDHALNDPVFMETGRSQVTLGDRRFIVKAEVTVEEFFGIDGPRQEPEIAHGFLAPERLTKYDPLTLVVGAERVRRVFMEFKSPAGISLVRAGQIASHLFHHGAYVESPDDDYVSNWMIDEIRLGDENVEVNPFAKTWIKAGEEWAA